MSAGSPLQVVAIDGPSGAGKSTIARAVAARLGWQHLDTGSMYRAVTLLFLERGVDESDHDAVAAGLARVTLRVGASGRVWIDDREVTAELRSPAVEARVSAVSAVPAVRARMRELQREQTAFGPLVAEGRDMTSVVFPDARYKFYLDASAEERARRRRRDFERDGRTPELAEVMAELARRDHLDSTRQAAPLRRVAEATYLDTTGLTVAEVVSRIVAVVEGDG